MKPENPALFTLVGTVEDIRNALRERVICYDGGKVVDGRIVDMSDGNGLIHFILPTDETGWNLAFLTGDDNRIQINQEIIKIEADSSDCEVKMIVHFSSRNIVPLGLFEYIHKHYNLDVIVYAGEYMLDSMIKIIFKRENHYFMYEEQGVEPFVEEVGKISIGEDGLIDDV